MTNPAAPMIAAPPAVYDDEPIHPYILDALRAARAGDLDALAWLESDCVSWGLIEPNAAILAVKEVYKPTRKPRKNRTSQDAPGRTRRAQTIPTHPKPGTYSAVTVR